MITELAQLFGQRLRNLRIGYVGLNEASVYVELLKLIDELSTNDMSIDIDREKYARVMSEILEELRSGRTFLEEEMARRIFEYACDFNQGVDDCWG